MEVSKFVNAGAHESITPGDTATSITATVINPTSGEYKNKSAIGAIVSVEDNSARITIDGTTPTNANGTSADVGHLVVRGQSWPVNGGASVKNFQVIDAVSGSASVIKITTFF